MEFIGKEGQEIVTEGKLLYLYCYECGYGLPGDMSRVAAYGPAQLEYTQTQHKECNRVDLANQAFSTLANCINHALSSVLLHFDTDRKGAVDRLRSMSFAIGDYRRALVAARNAVERLRRVGYDDDQIRDMMNGIPASRIIFTQIRG